MTSQKADLFPISISSVSKSFFSNTILHKISLQVARGEIFGLIGLNGAGKTTLIKIMLDLLPSDEGEITFFSEPAHLPKTRRHLAYLPEKFQPSLLLKGKEFLSLTLSYHNKRFLLAEAKEKAEMLGLDPDVLENKIGHYSKGMGQKLGLLAMFLLEVPLLILDEPMSGLDPSARVQLKDMMMRYKQQGNSIFFSSHILADVEEICDRMAVLHQGEVIFCGTPEVFLQSYGNKGLERAFLQAISFESVVT